MARFLSRCQCSRGEATRVGGHYAVASVNSWYKGMEVSVDRGNTHDEDVFTLKITGGSSSERRAITILTLTTEQIGQIQDMGEVREINLDILDIHKSMRDLYLDEYNKKVECGLNKKKELMKDRGEINEEI